jgi:nucleoside-diphosphate-sugar epimerase
MHIVLITGGCGFLGMNLLKKLATHDKRIIIVDNGITSSLTRTKQWIREHNLTDAVSVHNLNITNHNATSVMQKLIDNASHLPVANVDIYHLASIASPPFYKRYAVETLDVGYIGTKNVLELAKTLSENKITTKVLYTSTSEVYGDALEHPQKESYYGNVNPVGERSCYDESKRIGESLIFSYADKYNIDARIVRIFNTFGPGMSLSDGRVVTEIVKALLLGTQFTVYGNGLQTRTLSYVDDTISMLLQVMNSTVKTPVNIGNDENEKTVLEIADIAKAAYAHTFKKAPILQIKHAPATGDDPKVRKPCLDKYNLHLGKHNYTSIFDGLCKTLLYFRDGIDGVVNIL